MPGHRTFKRTPLSVLLLMLIGSTSGWATDNNNNSNTTLTVTANSVDSESTDADNWNQVAKKADSVAKNTRPIIETPQSISVITQAQMASQAALNVPQALRYNAGIGAEGTVQITVSITSISVVLRPIVA